MRYLHPVTFAEKFIASGGYAYPDGYEAWSIHRQPDGGRFFRVDYENHETGFAALAEALTTPEGIIERVDVVQFHTRPDASGFPAARANYTLMDGYAQIGQSISGGERKYEDIDLPQGAVLLTPFTVLRGQMHASHALTFDFHHRIALLPYAMTALGEDTLTIGGKTYTAHQYRQNADTILWLETQHKIPLKLTRDGVEITVTNYAAF